VDARLFKQAWKRDSYPAVRLRLAHWRRAQRFMLEVQSIRVRNRKRAHFLENLLDAYSVLWPRAKQIKVTPRAVGLGTPQRKQ
jgi:hypothetical protein